MTENPRKRRQSSAGKQSQKGPSTMEVWWCTCSLPLKAMISPVENTAACQHGGSSLSLC